MLLIESVLKSTSVPIRSITVQLLYIILFWVRHDFLFIYVFSSKINQLNSSNDKQQRLTS